MLLERERRLTKAALYGDLHQGNTVQSIYQPGGGNQAVVDESRTTRLTLFRNDNIPILNAGI